MIKKFTIVISLIILTGCGFSPMHSKKNNNNFYFEQVNLSGERALNQYLKIAIMSSTYSSAGKFFIDVKSEYSNIILTIDKTGKVTNYQLLIKIIFK